MDTLTIGWQLLGMLPREELDRVDTRILDEYYVPADGASGVRETSQEAPLTEQEG